MAKLRTLQTGALKGETIPFEVRPGVVESIRILPLLGGADADIARFAREFAVKRGAQPVDTDKEYNLGIHVYTLFLACQDPDSPAEKSEGFFASPEEILHPADGLDRGRIALLFEHQWRIQQDYAPAGASTVGGVEFFEWFEKTAEADEGSELPFERSPRAKQRAFVRGIARLARTSLLAKSGLGPSSQEGEMPSASAANTTTSSPVPATTPEASDR